MRFTTWSMCFVSGGRVLRFTVSRNSLARLLTQPCN